MKFKVGDRVRIVGCSDSCTAHLVGLECRITEEGFGLRDADGQPAYGYRVDADDGGWGFRSCHLEPITRPGLSADDEKFVKDLQDSLFSQLPDFNPKPRQGEIVQAGDVWGQ